jgi:ribosomal protein S27E
MNELIKLAEKIKELEALNKIMIGRELKMVELKKEIKELKKTGKYEEAALKYEELEMWDKAKEIRELNMGKISTINIECPHCGASQPLSSKSNEVRCKHCGKNYMIPRKVLELL